MYTEVTCPLCGKGTIAADVEVEEQGVTLAPSKSCENGCCEHPNLMQIVQLDMAIIKKALPGSEPDLLTMALCRMGIYQHQQPQVLGGLETLGLSEVARIFGNKRGITS